MKRILCFFGLHKLELCDFIETKHWIWNIYYCKNCRKIKLTENPLDNYGNSCLKYEKNN